MTATPTSASGPNPSPTTPVSGGAPPTIPPAPSSGSSKAALGAVGAVVVVVVIVVILLFAGIIPGLSSSSSSSKTSGSTASEQSAASSASSFASGVSGGPWSLVFAAGVVSVDGISTNVSNLYGNASCPLKDSAISKLTAPGFNGTYYNGQAEAWLLGFYSSAGGGSALLLFVAHGVTAEVGEMGGPGCYFSAISHPLGPGLIDSTTAASAADATTAGSAFIAAHPHANASYALTTQSYVKNGTSTNTSEWLIEYDSCASSVLETFVATVFATNDTVLGDTTYSGTCSGLTPIGSAFSAANPITSTCPTGDTYAANGCAAGDYTYTLTVEVSTVSFSSVLFEVRTAAGRVLNVTPAGGFSVMSIAGAVAAQSTAATEMLMLAPFSIYGAGTTCNGAACGPTTPLTSLYTILIDMGTASPVGLGYSFIVIGHGSYSGTTAPVALP